MSTKTQQPPTPAVQIRYFAPDGTVVEAEAPGPLVAMKKGAGK